MKRITSSLSPVVLFAMLACGGDDSDGSAGALEFRGEQPFLPGFDYDSEWLPAGSPVAIRATASASGGITVLAPATTDGSTIAPIAGGGSLGVDGSLALELSVRIDTAGISYEGVVDAFEYAIEAEERPFDAFAIDVDVDVTSTLEPAVLGEVPIPSVPGATLVLEVTGGEITTVFAGTCAAAREGFAQVVGALTTSGTVQCAATVEIEIPIIGTESFGPFEFDVVIPSATTDLDLGTRSLDSGETAASMDLCRLE